ncbi:RsmD family RNA methyltransferase [Portibacter lacus]|uniref:Methyltransferase n=1 Tax=Portibacter lacus TaxID=1099794 RepID=A0AA37WDS1_9BACT|nr:RsmD family RNA methyltransferase [Portibacter lacus]GLR16272.1 methyltransferase [Portibacter lacus]
MRIISGTFKGRKFYPPAKKWPTRPTTDYAKEGLFNMLMNEIDFEETKMLDLFGGTGNHCYEFISRGCNDATYVDKFGLAVKFVHQIAGELEVSDKINVVKYDVFKYVAKCTETYDYIFAGPPYALPTLDKLPDEIFATNILSKDGLFVLEHDHTNDFSDHPNFLKQRSYGSAIFAFFAHLK